MDLRVKKLKIVWAIVGWRERKAIGVCTKTKKRAFVPGRIKKKARGEGMRTEKEKKESLERINRLNVAVFRAKIDIQEWEMEIRNEVKKWIDQEAPHG